MTSPTNIRYCGEKIKGDFLEHYRRGELTQPYHPDCFTKMIGSAETPAEEAERVLEELWEEHK